MTMKVNVRIIAAVAVLAGTVPAAAGVPAWLQFLHWISGDSDRTSVPVMMMGDHMQMSRQAAAQPGDVARAEAIVAAARGVLQRYPDAATAERAGYKPFNQTGRAGEEVHFTSIGYSYAEGRRIDYAHPGSLLFQRAARGLVSVGVMYAANGSATAADLDRRAPLSVATWHRHVDFCWPTVAGDRAASDPRFGYAGTIHDEAACRAAHGYWLPVAFGWMTHVYPGRADPWGGETMTPQTAMDH